MKKSRTKNGWVILLGMIAVLLAAAAGVFLFRQIRADWLIEEDRTAAGKEEAAADFHPEEEETPGFAVPDYNGEDFIPIQDNLPDFTGEEIQEALEYIRGSVTGGETKEDAATGWERYSELDELGRCGAAEGLLHRSMMPDMERGPIGDVRPSGWHTVKYPELIEDLYLYNRCHLIAYAFTGQNANEKNLITGTRHLNVEGMLPFETTVLQYLYRTENHVLYRVTPAFSGEELVARGVEMEAFSIEDNGEGVCFHVFVYNIQPGIIIDYLTGESRAE